MLSCILGIGDSASGIFILVVLSTLALVLFIIVGRGAGRGDGTAGTTGETTATIEDVQTWELKTLELHQEPLLWMAIIGTMKTLKVRNFAEHF